MQSMNVSIAVPNVRKGVLATLFGELDPYFPQANKVISGVTRDAAGSPLAGCTVRLFNALTNANEQTVVSDAGGNYAFTVDPTQVYYVVGYIAGSPDRAGTTVNTLVGV